MNDAQGSPSAVRVARVPALVEEAMVRASSAADGRVALTTGVRAGGMLGASPGSP
jgi:hypothetical protein